MNATLAKVVGPRVPPDMLRRDPGRFRIVTALFLLGAITLVVATFLPWWHMKLMAPQYPKGLNVVAHINSMSGDISEIDILNHYIGMRKLDDAAIVERKIAWYAVGAMSLLLVGATLIRTRWAAFMTLPAIAFPYVFLADLYYWLWDFGQHLNPDAPLSAAIKPFTPTILGKGDIGQFHTEAVPGVGLLMAVGSGLILIAALWMHRRAYLPLSNGSATGAS